MSQPHEKQAIAKLFEKFWKHFRGNLSNKIDFAHRLGALARPGSRELRAVKIPASCDAWLPPKRRRNDSENFDFFGSLKSVFRQFGSVQEKLQPIGRQTQLQHQISLQIDVF